MANPKSKIQNQKSHSSFEVTSGSVDETQALGERLGRILRPGDVVALRGELGSGKTTLIQGIARGLGRDPKEIKSPTFVLMREYPGAVPLIHIDGYRLEGPPAVASLDVDLVFTPEKITLIEWSERFGELLPEERLELQLAHVSTNRRRLLVVPFGARAHEIAAQLKQARETTESTIENRQSKISAMDTDNAAPGS